MLSQVAIRGMVVRCSNVIPALKIAFFRCAVCKATVEVLIAHAQPDTWCLSCTLTPPLQVWMDRGRIEEPRACQQCGSKMSMELIHNRSMFSDKQV